MRRTGHVRWCIQKFPDLPPGARTANGTALCQWVQLYRYFVSQSSSFAAITICVASQRVFNFVSVYFVIDSVPRSKNAWSCTSTHPIKLRGVVLSEKAVHCEDYRPLKNPLAYRYVVTECEKFYTQNSL
jgi:hypothetical protein